MQDETELEIVSKLVERSHINVPERRALPDGAARFSLIRDAIASHLNEPAWFPPDRRPESDFDGAVIERRPNGAFFLRLL
jgi:hypothetical protein